MSSRDILDRIFEKDDDMRFNLIAGAKIVDYAELEEDE